MGYDTSWKEYIIVNKSLGMSAGKLAVQVSHASMAFITNRLRESIVSNLDEDGKEYYMCSLKIEKDLMDKWIGGIFTKVCMEAKNDNAMNKVVKHLEENGFKEGVDFYKIVDVGTTEFNGTPHWTAIGLVPMDSNREDLKKALKGLQLFKG